MKSTPSDCDSNCSWESDYEIQLAAVESVAALPAIEVAASQLFPAEDIAPGLRQQGLPVACFEQAANEGRLWTAIRTSTREPVGFALAKLVDGSAHLYEMDVHPEHGRRGLGAALVGAVVDWAGEQGHPSVTLTTFRHLPWNAPFYGRLGFVEVSEGDLTPELAQHLDDEARRGLDRSRRVAMCLMLDGRRDR